MTPAYWVRSAALRPPISQSLPLSNWCYSLFALQGDYATAARSLCRYDCEFCGAVFVLLVILPATAIVARFKCRLAEKEGRELRRVGTTGSGKHTMASGGSAVGWCMLREKPPALVAYPLDFQEHLEFRVGCIESRLDFFQRIGLRYQGIHLQLMP